VTKARSISPLAILLCGASLGLSAIGGCSKPTSAVAVPAVANQFSSVEDRLHAEAKGKSVNGTTVTISPVKEGPEGRKIVAARRTRGETTTEYTLQFRLSPTGWVCTEAEAVETGPGSDRSAHRLGSTSTEIDQLILWLGW
jgi:hypothetical protein